MGTGAVVRGVVGFYVWVGGVRGEVEVVDRLGCFRGGRGG